MTKKKKIQIIQSNNFIGHNIFFCTQAKRIQHPLYINTL
jgi:hypothetical protein